MKTKGYLYQFCLLKRYLYSKEIIIVFCGHRYVFIDTVDELHIHRNGLLGWCIYLYVVLSFYHSLSVVAKAHAQEIYACRTKIIIPLLFIHNICIHFEKEIGRKPRRRHEKKYKKTSLNFLPLIYSSVFIFFFFFFAAYIKLFCGRQRCKQ